MIEQDKILTQRKPLAQRSLIIAHVCPYYSPAIGGVKQVVEELAKRQSASADSNANAQSSERHEVHVFTSDWDKEKRIEVLDEVINGVNVHRCKHYLKIGDFSTVWPGVYKKLIELKPDIIHAHVTGHLHTFLAMKAAKKLGAPFVITTHCPWESKRSKAATVANWVSYKMFPVLKYADSIIAITEWEHLFLKDEGVKSENIHTIPNGMSAEFFGEVEPNDFKEKHNIKNKMILFFGRMNLTKNPQGFLDVAEEVLKERQDATFVLCGPDEGELLGVTERIKNFPKSIQDNIRLLPATRDRKEVIKMYQAADLYIMPSMREGLPLCLFEAYASGLPVIGAAVNGIPYELENGINGFLLPYNATNKFIEKTNILLDDGILRCSMGINNQQKAREFDWDIINKRTMKVYETKYIKKLF